jgi:hypothetical protein
MSDLFDQHFPKTRQAFSPSTLSSERFLREKYGENAPLIGGYLLVADDLLKRALSWYESDNLFASPRFLSKLYLFREFAKTMANNKASERNQDKDASWKAFLDCRLTDDQLVELDEWQPSALEIFEYVDATLLDGYKLSLSYNKQTQLASCTLIDRLKSRVSGGYGLSTSDTNAAAALKAAMFKHCLVLERSWASLVGTPSRGGRRG